MPNTGHLAAILAEMRGNEFDDPHLDADGIIGARRLARDWADRIEAAAERERDEDRQLAAIAESDEAFARCARCDRPERAPGNAAAMRDALTAFVDSIQWLCDGDERGVFKKQFAPLLSEARAALATPTRNCDVGTENDLHASFVRHCDACNPPGGCCHRKDTRGMLDTNCASILKCFARFAIANKEGDKK